MNYEVALSEILDAYNGVCPDLAEAACCDFDSPYEYGDFRVYLQDLTVPAFCENALELLRMGVQLGPHYRAGAAICFAALYDIVNEIRRGGGHYYKYQYILIALDSYLSQEMLPADDSHIMMLKSLVDDLALVMATYIGNLMMRDFEGRGNRPS